MQSAELKVMQSAELKVMQSAKLKTVMGIFRLRRKIDLTYSLLPISFVLRMPNRNEYFPLL